MEQNEEVKVDAPAEELEEVTPPEGETIDWKARAELLEKKAIEQRAKTKELRNQLNKFQSSVLPAEQKVENKSEGFDYGQKAFLRASGISSNEYDLVEEVMQDTGKSLEAVLESKWFQSELKERRDAQATREALPGNSKRPAQSTRDSVEYWIAKGTLPPMEQRELRAKVVEAKIAAEKAKAQFTDNPVV